jgi:small-conductance mechanosensitive channel
VLVTKFGDFSVNLLLTFWVRDYTTDGLGASEVREEIYRRFTEEGIKIPLPTSRVFHETPPPEAATEA